MTLNTNNVCSACHGRVHNVPGRRRTIEQLTTIHNETCPGLRRTRKDQP